MNVFCTVKQIQLKHCVLSYSFAENSTWPSSVNMAWLGRPASNAVEVGTGGWIPLKDTKGVNRVVPCFVIETSGDRIVVAVPGTQVLSEAGEWVIPGSTEGAQRTYSVNGVEAAFHRVDCTALLRSKPAKVTEAWRNQEGTVREPDWKMLRKVYYGLRLLV